jgi:hypothetical protein
MRNLAWAAASAPPRTRRDGDGIVFVERPWFGLLVIHAATHPNAPATKQEFAAFQNLLQPELHDRVAMVSYEQIVMILGQHGEQALARDVLARIGHAVAARN